MPSRDCEVFFRDLCDVAVMVTGDSDLAPAVRSAQALFPAKQVYLLSPYKRLSFELKSLCPGRSFRVKSRAYVDHQLPNPFPLADGSMLTKPAKW